MKRLFFLCLAVLPGKDLVAQELFVATEPASNMPRHSVGLRANAEVPAATGTVRFLPEVMVGMTKHLMLHGSLFYSDFHQAAVKYEGFSVYGKYRFLSRDTVQRHFRGAFYGRYSSSHNPVVFDEINLQGDNSGIQGGVIFTQLLHKLALSASGGVIHALNNGAAYPIPATLGNQFNYSLSAGYLVLPKEYTSYNQTNMNLYAELLGKLDERTGKQFVELAPAVQFIFRSRLRVDFSKTIQLGGEMSRSGKNQFLMRLEYTMFNVW